MFPSRYYTTLHFHHFSFLFILLYRICTTVLIHHNLWSHQANTPTGGGDGVLLFDRRLSVGFRKHQLSTGQGNTGMKVIGVTGGRDEPGKLYFICCKEEDWKEVRHGKEMENFPVSIWKENDKNWNVNLMYGVGGWVYVGVWLYVLFHQRVRV